MPDLAHVVVWLVIAFWSPNNTKPLEVEALVFDTEDQCSAKALELDAEWIAKMHGGSTSYACISAYQAPSL